MWSVAQGLRTGPKKLMSEVPPNANSCRFSGDTALRRRNSDACLSHKLVGSDGVDGDAAKTGLIATPATAVAAVNRKFRRLCGVGITVGAKSGGPRQPLQSFPRRVQTP